MQERIDHHHSALTSFHRKRQIAGWMFAIPAVIFLCAWPIGWMVATVISILFYRKGEWNTVPEEVREALMTESTSM